MSTFFNRWQFKHPKPGDFFAIANEVSGQDLTPFFDQVYRSSDAFDYGIQELRSDREGDRVVRSYLVKESPQSSTECHDARVPTHKPQHRVLSAWRWETILLESAGTNSKLWGSTLNDSKLGHYRLVAEYLREKWGGVQIVHLV